MRLFCGVDGGGTRTRAVLTDESGALLGFGASSGSNPKAVGLDGAAAAIEEALRGALEGRNAACELQLFLGIAGVRTEYDRSAVREAMEPALERLGLNDAELAIGHDLDVALAAALGGEPGVVLVVGTGSAAFGCNASGEKKQAGGWGWFIDDPGSGYWLGYQAMRAAARSADGRLPRSLLEERVREFLRIKTLNEMPNIIYNPHFSRERVAELAPIIFAAAEAGDDAAEAILSDAFSELALMATTVARSLSLENALVAAVGGVTEAGTSFKVRLEAALENALPGTRLIRPRVAPVVGAVILALQEQGQQLATDAQQRLNDAVNERMRKPAVAASRSKTPSA